MADMSNVSFCRVRDGWSSCAPELLLVLSLGEEGEAGGMVTASLSSGQFAVCSMRPSFVNKRLADSAPMLATVLVYAAFELSTWA
jgi:hypothetical protein